MKATSGGSWLQKLDDGGARRQAGAAALDLRTIPGHASGIVSQLIAACEEGRHDPCRWLV
jgi:hypothetical protein